MDSKLRRAWLAFSRTRVGRPAHSRLVRGVQLAKQVESLDRPRWLYRPSGVPAGTFHFRPAAPVTDADVELCRRLIAAYDAAVFVSQDRRGMWTDPIFSDRQRALSAALRDKDPARLASTMATMFRSDFVLGLAPGSLGTARQGPVARRIGWVQTLSKLTAVGEALGAVRLENPEQGTVALPLKEGGDALVERIEALLGHSLDFPDVGAAYGPYIAGRLIAADAPDQVYGAVRLRDAIDLHWNGHDRPPAVVEIGGGYGAMAYSFLQLRRTPYTIVDLPIVNVMQGYFLGKALGAQAVSLYGEATGDINVLPDHALAGVPAPFDVLVNKDSMPEIPLPAARRYLEWARESCTGMFFSYNQEAAAEFGGEAQIVVAEVLGDIGGFERVRRDPSWVRRGYVEEVFLPTSRAES
ncbi:MAG TPA: putative sugar O-methyltransferase [Solirubrobacteraceae bacterium]|jgi:hypothetical protein